MGAHALVALVAVLLSPVALSQRVLIKHLPDRAPEVLSYAQKEGLSLVGQTRGLLVLERRLQQQLRPTKLQLLLLKARRWPGVLFAEEDKPRYMHRPVDASFEQVAAGSSQGGLLRGFCVDKDVPLSNTSIIPEYRPYGVAQIQATSPKLPNRTDDKGVILCIIDSGLDSRHPDFANESVDGCKYEDAFAPGGCPFEFGRDLVGHGTHVAGTMAAQLNGYGVVGVIPGPAEVYIVRVFNDSGDVNQGQGLVYGSTLIIAFTQCEGRLAAQQVTYPQRNYRMVVSMSLGAPGPLTIERMFFREAAKRGDILFVASSGNNGSSPTLQDGQLTTTINPGNYPGTYPEVIAVSAVDCNNNLGIFSQKNPSVDIAAPGVEVLSTASQDVRPSARSGGFKSRDGKIFIRGGIAGSENQIWNAGVGSIDGEVVDCGFGFSPCPQAKGKIALLQYDPKIKNITMPAAWRTPPPGAAAGAAGGSPPQGPQTPPMTGGGSRPPVPAGGGGGGGGGGGTGGGTRGGTGVPTPLSPIRPGGVGAGSGGSIPSQVIVPVPTRFNCDLMEFAMQQGAKGVLIGAPPVSSGYYGAWGYVSPDSYLDLPLVANLKCDGFNCTCWPRIANLTKLPAAGLTLRQFGLVKDAVAAAQKAGKPFEGTVASQVDAFQRLSGTSMAVPHASSAIARVWAAFPWCRADTIRTAFEESALDLGPKGKDVQFGHGLLQAEAAFDYLSRQPCAKGEQAAAVAYKQQDEMTRGGTKSAVPPAQQDSRQGN